MKKAIHAQARTARGAGTAPLSLAPSDDSAKSGRLSGGSDAVVRLGFAAVGSAAFLALLAAGATLSGCIVAPVGGAVAGYAVLGEDLSPGQQFRDVGIKAAVQAAWGSVSPELADRLDATVFDGQVLITGRVPNRRRRAEAVRLARRVAGVQRVFDQVVVGPDTHFIDSARDSWIAAQLRGELVADIDVKSIDYVIETSDAVVYLMGFARTQPELDRVIGRARTVAGVRRVVSFVRVLSAADINQPIPGDEDALPPPGPDDDYGAPPPARPYPPPPAPSYAPPGDEPGDAAPPPDEPNDAGPDMDEPNGPPQRLTPAAPPSDRGGVTVQPLGPQ
jgi:osmotically-inducible protein OsmY